MKLQSSIVTTLLVIGVSLTAITLLYNIFFNYLSSQTAEIDVYIQRFKDATQQYLIPLSGGYNIYSVDDTTSVLYTYLLITNVGTKPIYYRHPIKGLIVYMDKNGERGVLEADFSVWAATSAFYPKLHYKVYTITTSPPDITPLRVILFINDVEFEAELKPVSWPLGEIYFCYSCGHCETVLSTYSGSDRIVFLVKDITIDKDPCIDLSGDYRGIIFDCMMYDINGSGTERAFLLSNPSNITIQRCNVAHVSKAFDVILPTNVSITSVVVSDATHVMYINDPFNPSSFDMKIGDVVYGDRKMYYFRPFGLFSLDPFLPLSIWVKDFNGVSINGGGSLLEKVYPTTLILNSSDVNISDINILTYDPYGVILLNSSNVRILNSVMHLNSSSTGVYTQNSDYELSNVNIYSTSALDLYILDSNATLGDLLIR